MYCIKCGSRLVKKEDGIDGLIDFCENCNTFQYHRFNVAVSMIIIHNDNILLVKQYGRDRNILVAGYVNHLETAEEAVIREIKEEVGLEVISYRFNESRFYEPSDTLILNFVCYTKGEIKTNDEIDDYGVYSIDEAQIKIAPNSLASYFLNQALKKQLVK